MSLISFSDNFSQVSLYQNHQLQLQYISKFDKYNGIKTAWNEKSRYTGDYFCDGRIFSRKCSKSSVFINSISLNCIQCIFISRDSFFYVLGIFETGIKKNLLLFNNKFLEKSRRKLYKSE